MLIATVFPYVDHIENRLGIFTVSGALFACKVAKQNDWIKRDCSGKYSCDSSRYGDLIEKLAELDVDPKAYDKAEGPYLLPPPSTPTPSKEAETVPATTDHVEEDTSDANHPLDTEHDNGEEDESETDAIEDDESEEDETALGSMHTSKSLRH